MPSADDERRKRLLAVYATHDERDRVTIEEFNRILDTCVCREIDS